MTDLVTGKPKLVQDPKESPRVIDEGAAVGEGAMTADYMAPQWSLVAFLRLLQNTPAGGATHLKIWTKSKYDARFLLQLAEADESGYNHLLNVGGGETWHRHELPLRDFKLSVQLSHLLAVELSGATGEPGPNTLWLDDVVFFVPAEE